MPVLFEIEGTYFRFAVGAAGRLYPTYDRSHQQRAHPLDLLLQGIHGARLLMAGMF